MHMNAQKFVQGALQLTGAINKQLQDLGFDFQIPGDVISEFASPSSPLSTYLSPTGGSSARLRPVGAGLCKRAVGHISRRDRESACVYCELLHWNCILASFETIPDKGAASEADVTLFATNDGTEPYVCDLNPNSLFIADQKAGLTLVACKDSAKKLHDSNQRALPVSHCIAAVSWPRGAGLVTWHYADGISYRQELPLKLAKQPADGEDFLMVVDVEAMLKKKIPESVLNKGIVGAPVFELSKVDPKFMNLVGIVVRVEPNNRIVALNAERVLAHVEMLLSLELLTKQSGEDSRKQGRWCSSLRRFTAHSDRNLREELHGLGCSQIVRNVMKKNMESVYVQEQCCMTIRNLAIDAEGCEALELAKAPEAVCEAMAKHGDCAPVQEQGCAALGNLACAADGKVSVPAAGGIKLILAAMEKHERDAAVQLQGIGALWNLGVESEKNRETIARLGGLARICAAMSNHAGDVRLQTSACGAIGNLVVQNSLGKDAARKADAPALITTAMRANATEAVAQQQGCAALWSLATGSPANQDAIASADGITVIIAALENHSQLVHVVENACGALRSLTVNRNSLKEACVEGGGVELMFKAMSEFARNETVIKPLIGALWNIAACKAETVVEAMLEGERLKLFAEVVESFPENNPIIESACGFIRNLVASNAELVVPKVIEEKALEAVCASFEEVEDNFKNPILLRNLLDIFIYVCHFGTRFGPTLEELGVPFLLRKSMRAHLGDVLIQERGCQVFRWLAGRHLGIRDVAVKAGAVRLLCEAMGRHADNVQIQIRACEALLQLSGGSSSEYIDGVFVEDHVEGEGEGEGKGEEVTHDDVHVKSFAADVAAGGGISVVIKAIKAHSENVALLEPACGIVRNVYNVRKREGRTDLMRSQEARVLMECLVPAMEANVQSLEVQRQCCALVRDVPAWPLISSVRVARAVVAACRVHEPDTQIQNFGLVALKVALFQGPPKDYVHKDENPAGVAVACAAVAALQTHLTTSESISAKACEVLAISAGLHASVAAAAEGIGAVAHVLQTMSVHGGSAAVQAHGFACLRLLERAARARELKNKDSEEKNGEDAQPSGVPDKEGKSKAVKSAERVCHAMFTHPTDTTMQREAGLLLFELIMSAKADFQEIDPAERLKLELADYQNKKKKLFVEEDDEVEAMAQREAEKAEERRIEEVKQAANVVEEPRSKQELTMSCRWIATVLCDAMELNPDDAHLQQHACKALWALTNDNAGGKCAVIKCGGIACVCQVLSKFREDDHLHVARDALAALWGILANRPEGRFTASKHTAATVVCKTMEKWPKDAPLQERGLGALASILAGHKQNQEECLNVGGCFRICEAIWRHRENANLIRLGALAIVALSAGFPRGRAELGKCKAIDLLCNMLLEHPTEKELIRAATRALWNISVDDPEVKESIIERKALKAVLDAMRNFRNDKALQRTALEFLQGIASGSQIAQEAVVNEDGMETICLTMRQHRFDDPIQKLGSTVVGNLCCRNNANRSRLSAVGGVEIVCGTLETSDCVEVLEATTWALSIIVAGKQKLKKAAINAGALDSIHRVLIKWPDHNMLQKNGSAAKRRLENVEGKMLGPDNTEEESDEEEDGPVQPRLRLSLGRRISQQLFGTGRRLSVTSAPASDEGEVFEGQQPQKRRCGLLCCRRRQQDAPAEGAV
eukprot:TRINITY_DN6792_c0_g1_i1.p1 TRINITY_DN6792_c0_g1~~TRINITY_DN6792_c0_g1_i1.p1  ORF type:complete len:1674 (-),score=350.51 TRINITY_DN6792_c0_g1_i1:268-5289(-)